MFNTIHDSNSDSEDDAEPTVLPVRSQMPMIEHEASNFHGAQVSRSPVEAFSKKTSGFLRRVNQLTIANAPPQQCDPCPAEKPPQPLVSSFEARDANSSPRMSPPKPRCNVLVIGGTQCGKSSLINAYRSCVLNNDRWSPAAVGRCGWIGTPAVDVYPSHPLDPSWALIDTPGRIYDDLQVDTSDDSLLISCLLEGMAMPTKLSGKGSVPISELAERKSYLPNRPHQCIIVVPAYDFVEDKGFLHGLMKWKSRYVQTSHSKASIDYLRKLVHHLRDHFGEPPFVVVSFMDGLGGASNVHARRALIDVLSECVPLNSVFFCSFPPDKGCESRLNNRSLEVDEGTCRELIRLHQSIISRFRWAIAREFRSLRYAFATSQQKERLQ